MIGFISAATIFEDTFTRANSATVGNGWTEVDSPGYLSISSNTLLASDTSTGNSEAYIGTGALDTNILYNLTFIMKINSLSASTSYQAYTGLSDASQFATSDFIRFQYKQSDGNIYLQTDTGGPYPLEPYTLGSYQTLSIYDLNMSSNTFNVQIGSNKYTNGGLGYGFGGVNTLDTITTLTGSSTTINYNIDSVILKEQLYITPTDATQVNILNITANGGLFINNTYFNVSDIEFNVSYEVLNTDAGNFTNNSITSLTSLTDGTYLINFQVGYNNTNTSTGNYTYYVDTTNPLVNQIGNVSSNTFSVDFSTIFNVTEANPSTCFINITELENVTTPDNFYINCTDTQVFTSAGSHNAYVTATDLAGNIGTYDYNFTIQPFVYVNFLDANATGVTNYNYIIFHPDGRKTSVTGVDNPVNLSPVNNGVLDLGLHIIEFSKFGYETTNVSITINESSGGTEYNFTVPGARVIFYVYDQVTNTLISPQNIDLELIGPYNTVLNTSTGIFNFSLLVPGNYQAKVSTDDYISTEKTFTFDAMSIYTSNFYLLPVNYSLAGYVTIVVYKSDGTFGLGVPVTANQWDSASSSFIETFRTRSNPNGIAVVPIILENELYRFCAEFTSGTICFPENEIGQSFSRAQNGEEISILESAFYPQIPITISNLQFTLLDHTVTNLLNITLQYDISYSWLTNDGADATVCSKLEKDFNFTKTLVDAIECSTTNSGTFSHTYSLNASFSYLFTVYQMKSDGTIKILYTEPIQGTDTLPGFLEDFGLFKFFLIALVIIMIGVIPFIRSPLLIVSDVVIIYLVAWLFLIPQSLSITTVGVFIVMGIVTLWGVNKR